MKYIEGFCFSPHFYFHSVESVNPFMIQWSLFRRFRTGKKERERNTRKSRFAPNENAKIHGGSRGMICNLFFPSASRREFIAEKIRVSASPLPINTIPITSGVRLSRIRVPWQLATYLPSSFPSLLFHFVSWKQKYTYIIEGERKYGVLKKNNEKEEEEKEDGKGKERFDSLSRW